MAAVWAWQDEYGQWQNYDAAQCKQIEEAKSTGKRSISVRVGRYSYTVDLVSLKQTNDSTHTTRPIKQVSAAKPKMPSKEVEQMFDAYKAAAVKDGADPTDDSMQASSFVALAADMGVSVEDPVILTIPWKGESQVPSKISRDDWARCMTYLAVDSKKKLKAAVPNLRKMIEAKDVFKQFYNFVFTFVRDNERATVLPCDTAVAYWKLLLTGRWKYLDQWCTFINDVHRKSVTKDVWRQLLDLTNLTSFEQYDTSGAWPSAMDDFVEWMKTQPKH